MSSSPSDSNVELSTVWPQPLNSSTESQASTAGGGIGVTIVIAVGGILLIAIVVTVSVLLCRRRIRLNKAKPVPRVSLQEAAEAVPTTRATCGLWSTDASQSGPAPVVPTVGQDRLTDAFIQSRPLNNNSYVKRTFKQQCSKTSAAETPVHRHSMPEPLSTHPSPVAKTLPPGCSAPASDRHHPKSILHHASHAGTTTSLEQLSNSPRLGANRAAEMTHESQLMQWHSMASADSGLASSLSSFSDTERFAGATAEVYSSEHSLTSYDSAAADCSLSTAVCLPRQPGFQCSSAPPLPPQRKDLKGQQSTQGSCRKMGGQAAANIPEEAFVGCSLDLISELVSQFKQLSSSSSGVPIGTVYCTPSFAIADFDESGGCLFFAPDRSCSLTIPPGALDKRQTVYFGVIYESGSDGCAEANFTPTYECGPSGLHFLKPVLLRTSHCIGPEGDLKQVSAYVREDDCSEWSDSSDANVSYGPGTAVLSLMHFTGYKLATSISGGGSGSGGGSCPRGRSGIPRPVRQSANIQKQLYLCSFLCVGKVRVYYMNRDEALYDNLCAQEIANGNSVSSPKKPFVFTCHEGDLVVKVVHAVSTQRKFPARTVLANSYDYAELSKIDGITSFDILIKQESGTAESYITAIFETRHRSGDLTPKSLERLSEELLLPVSLSMMRQMSFMQSVAGAALPDAYYPSLPSSHRPVPSEAATATSMLSAGRSPSSWQQQQLAPLQASAAAPGQHQDCDALTAGAGGQSVTTYRPAGPAADPGRTSGNRSGSGAAAAVAMDPLTLSLATATESCECMTGAAGGSYCALHDGGGGNARCLSPGEYSDDSCGGCVGPQRLQRNKARASKESGYASVSSAHLSPFPSFGDLHGPGSLSAAAPETTTAATQAAPADDDLPTVVAPGLAPESRWQQQQDATQPLSAYHDRPLEPAGEQLQHGYQRTYRSAAAPYDAAVDDRHPSSSSSSRHRAAPVPTPHSGSQKHGWHPGLAS